MAETNVKYLEGGLTIQVDFYKTTGKWYTSGNVNIGDLRLHSDRDDFLRAIIENQTALSSNNWIGEYHVVTQDLPEYVAHADYHEFTKRMFTADEWNHLRCDYVTSKDQE
jgi:hypothetical protein